MCVQENIFARLFSLFVLDEEFQAMQTDFMEKYYQHFDDTEENKFIYTDIQKEYVRKVFFI